MQQSNVPALALDWGLNNTLGGILNTLLNLLSGLLDPIRSIIELIAGLFGGGGS